MMAIKFQLILDLYNFLSFGFLKFQLKIYLTASTHKFNQLKKYLI